MIHQQLCEFVHLRGFERATLVGNEKRSYSAPELTEFGSIGALTSHLWKCSPGTDHIVGADTWYQGEVPPNDTCQRVPGG